MSFRRIISPLPAPGWGWWVVAMALLLPFAYAFWLSVSARDDFDEVTRAMSPFDLPGGCSEAVKVASLTRSGRYTYHWRFFWARQDEIRPFTDLSARALRRCSALACSALRGW